MGIVDYNGHNEAFQRLLTEEAEEGAMMQLSNRQNCPQY